MKTTYDLVRERIVELVPELKELKFGCYVKIDEALPERVTGVRRIARHDFIITDVTREWWPVSELNILGTEPQLHDVLRAIENTGKIRGTIGQKINVKASDFDSVEAAKSFAYNHPEKWDKEVELAEWMKELLIRWNLSEHLSLQSEPLLLFLKGLLQVENI